MTATFHPAELDQQPGVPTNPKQLRQQVAAAKANYNRAEAKPDRRVAIWDRIEGLLRRADPTDHDTKLALQQLLDDYVAAIAETEANRNASQAAWDEYLRLRQQLEAAEGKPIEMAPRTAARLKRVNAALLEAETALHQAKKETEEAAAPLARVQVQINKLRKEIDGAAKQCDPAKPVASGPQINDPWRQLVNLKTQVNQHLSPCFSTATKRQVVAQRRFDLAWKHCGRANARYQRASWLAENTRLMACHFKQLFAG